MYSARVLQICLYVFEEDTYLLQNSAQSKKVMLTLITL